MQVEEGALANFETWRRERLYCCSDGVVALHIAVVVVVVVVVVVAAADDDDDAAVVVVALHVAVGEG